MGICDWPRIPRVARLVFPLKDARVVTDAGWPVSAFVKHPLMLYA
jgi:hypothetical protein